MKDIYVITASFVGEIRRDFKGYCEMVKKAGYQGLELFDGAYGGMSAPELKEYLASLGLKVISAHVKPEDTEKQFPYLQELGCPYIVCPGLRVTSKEDAYEKAAYLNQLGKLSQTYGIKYGYHNHDNDFDVYDGEAVIDIFLQNTDPSLVFFELDAAWAWRAGVNAAEFITRNAYAGYGPDKPEDAKGRFELIHVKETARVLTDDDKNIFKKMGPVETDKEGRPVFSPAQRALLNEHQKINCQLGQGIINMPAIKAAAENQGVAAYIVEREYAYTGDNYTTLLADRQYLAGI